jgi:hypothetical protein
MPIPLDELNRALIPRVLTPAATVAELLYLFAEQPEPRRCYVVVRVGRDEYDVLALDELGDPVARRRESILTFLRTLRRAARGPEHIVNELTSPIQQERSRTHG